MFQNLKKFFVLFIFSFSVSMGAQADPAKNLSSLQKSMLRNIDFIQDIFMSHYAPREWKAQFSQWDVEKEIQTVKDEVIQNPKISVREFHRKLAAFFNSTKDYHVDVRFVSTESARLPFQVKGASGRYFLVYIDRERLPLSAFPFLEGDEIIEFDGRPITDVVNELRSGGMDASPQTDQAMAELYVTIRSARVGHVVPKGPINLKIRRIGTKQDVPVQLAWIYKRENLLFPETFAPANRLEKLHLDPKNEIFTHLDKDMRVPFAEEFSKFDQQVAENPHWLGARNSFIPDLGVKIWQSPSESPFHAYIFQNTDRKLIGFVRVPHYSAGEAEAIEFAKIIRHLQATTEALVIDQTSNPGGSLFYVYALTSMLTDQVMQSPLEKVGLTPEGIVEALKDVEVLEKVKSDEEAREFLGNSFGGYPVTYSMAMQAKEYIQFQIDEWNRGKRLTDSHYFVLDDIQPSPMARYTQPILLLVNELDFSGGDFFPAILQDNKRVTVMGVKTAGAGGYVRNVEYPNLLGIQQFSYTGSLAIRVNGKPIENLGVTPDIEYQLKAEDFQFGFASYVEAIQKAVSDLL